jgi:hypothetical protein
MMPITESPESRALLKARADHVENLWQAAQPE